MLEKMDGVELRRYCGPVWWRSSFKLLPKLEWTLGLLLYNGDSSEQCSCQFVCPFKTGQDYCRSLLAGLLPTFPFSLFCTHSQSGLLKKLVWSCCSPAVSPSVTCLFALWAGIFNGTCLPLMLGPVHSSLFQPHRPFFQFSESTLYLPTLGILWGIEGKGSFFLLEMFLPISFNLLVPILILSLNVIPQRSVPSRSIWYFPLVTLIIICIIICFMPIPPTRLLSSLRTGTLCVLLSKAHWVLSTMPDTLQALNRSRLCKQKYEFIHWTDILRILLCAGALDPSTHRPLRGFNQVNKPQEDVTFAHRVSVQASESGEGGVSRSAVGLAKVSWEGYVWAESSPYFAIFNSRYQTAT